MMHGQKNIKSVTVFTIAFPFHYSIIELYSFPWQINNAVEPKFL